MNRGRGRYFDELFSKDNVREMMRYLRDNAVVWYASDQSYGGKGSVLLPFFGEPAMTNTAIGRIAKASGAAVLPYFCRRLADDRYVMSIGAPLAGVTERRRGRRHARADEAARGLHSPVPRAVLVDSPALQGPARRRCRICMPQPAS